MHHYDLWRYLTGAEVEEVSVLSRSALGDDDVVTISARLSSGALVSAVFREGAGSAHGITLFGSEGSVNVSLPRFAGLEPDHLPHALVTEYRPGAGIGWHKDRPDFEDVIGVSLVSECRFRLRSRTVGKWQRASLVLAPRSIYLLSGPARREWEHSIPPGGLLRYSVTFRSLRPGKAG